MWPGAFAQRSCTCPPAFELDIRAAVFRASGLCLSCALPGRAADPANVQKQPASNRLLPLLEDDPLAQEQFALVFTPQFSIVLVLGKDADDELRFQFSFMPQVVMSVWRILRSRLRMIRPQQLEFIDPLVEKFAPIDPNYRVVSQFNRWMLAYLPQPFQASELTEASAQGRSC